MKATPFSRPFGFWTRPFTPAAIVFAFAFGVCLTKPALVSAQVTGQLSGTVVDQTGKPVANATVTLDLMDLSVSGALTTTTGAGTFFLPNLRPVNYELTIEAPGFKKYTEMGVKVDPTSETSLPPIKLEPGDPKKDPGTEVPAPTQTLQTSNGDVVSTANQDQVAQLPLGDRDPLNVLDTLAGINNNGRGLGRTIDGESVSFDNITFDGINIQDSFIRNQSLSETTLGLHTDQISEVTVVTSNPSSIYTGGSGQVAFSTPGGSSNILHGAAYLMNIPGGINAQTFMNNVAPATPTSLQLNQVGFNLGGRIVKDKLFFFLNYEANLDGSTVTYSPEPVPTAPLTSSNPAFQKVLNLIPSNPTGLYWPLVNDGNATYTGLSRFDYRPTSRQAFSLTMSFLDGTTDLPGDSSGLSRQDNVTLRDVTSFFSGAWRWSPTAHLTNEVRIGANLPRVIFQNSLRNQFPYVLDFDDATYNGVAWNYPEPMSGVDPQGRSDYLYSYQDNLTYVKGRHSLQAGFSVQSNRLRTYGFYNGSNLTSLTVPTYYVAEAATGTVDGAHATFNVLSPTSGYVGGSTPISHLSTNLISWYFQDNWRVRPSLTLNLGLRYDYQSPVRETTGSAILPVLSGGNAAAEVYNPNLAFSFVSPSNGLYKPDRNNFAPHVGFAWKIGDKLPFVLRGAYSISYVDDDLLRDMSTFALQNPYQSVGNSVFLNSPVSFATPPTVPGLAAPVLNLPGLARAVFANDGGAPVIQAVDPNLRTPYVQQFNFGVETQLKGIQLGAHYVGNRLVKGLISVDRNPLTLTPASLSYIEQQISSQSQCMTCLLYGVSPADVGYAAQLLAINNQSGPYSLFGNPLAVNGIRLLSNLGRSRYDGLQLGASRRVAPGLSFTANYSWSKTLGNIDDYIQGAFFPYSDINKPSLNFAPSPNNLEHAFKSTLIYDLPFANRTASGSFARKVFGGFSLSWIMIAQSGAPFSLLSCCTPNDTIGLDSFNIPQDSGENTVSTSLTAGQIEQYFGIHKDASGNLSYVNNFPASAFSQPAPGTLGNLQRRMFTGPGAFDMNLGLQKTITITERARILLRAESINAFNNESWNVSDQYLYTNSAGQPAFSGSITQWIQPRSFQFHARVTF